MNIPYKKLYKQYPYCYQKYLETSNTAYLPVLDMDKDQRVRQDKLEADIKRTKSFILAGIKNEN